MDIKIDIDNYLKTLKGVEYKSLYNFAIQQSKAFETGYRLAEERNKTIAFDFYYDMSKKMGVPENLITENRDNFDYWFENYKLAIE